jgi:hypothetical protein
MKTPSHIQNAQKDLQNLKVGELSKSWRDCSTNVVASQITVQRKMLHLSHSIIPFVYKSLFLLATQTKTFSHLNHHKNFHLF